jgi:hypothetical protein
MLDWLARRLEVSTTVAAIVLALIVVQVAMQVYALVDLARRYEVRGGRKWVWALVITFGNLVGAVVYLVAGRTEQAAEDASGVGSGASTAGGEAARRAVETLYGPHDRR